MSTSRAEAVPALGLVSPQDGSPEVAAGFGLLPDINVFRAMANADTLFAPYMRYLVGLFGELALDAALERMVVLRVVQRSRCSYAWRQNVVVARAVGVTDQQIAALDRAATHDDCFTAEQKVAFDFVDEAMDLVEVTENTYRAAARNFSDRQLTELLFVVGTYMFVSRLLRTGRVPLDAEPAASPQ